MSEPLSISTLVDEPLERFSRLAENYTGSDRPENEIHPSVILSKLETAKFPERHRHRTELCGPGLLQCDRLWPKVKSGDCLILLLGNRGSGKTQIATEWARRRISSKLSAGRYVKCADLIGEIKSTWHDGGKSLGTENDVLRRFYEVKYLVIDEFHEAGASDWESRTLINIIDHRYDAMLSTVIIANLSREEASNKLNPSLRDRANETGGMVFCNWESYRK